MYYISPSETTRCLTETFPLKKATSLWCSTAVMREEVLIKRGIYFPKRRACRVIGRVPVPGGRRGALKGSPASAFSIWAVSRARFSESSAASFKRTRLHLLCAEMMLEYKHVFWTLFVAYLIVIKQTQGTICTDPSCQSLFCCHMCESWDWLRDSQAIA